MSVDRTDCCATWTKPCSYHEGWQDAADALTERAEKAEAALHVACEAIAESMAESRCETCSSPCPPCEPLFRVLAALDPTERARVLLDQIRGTS